MGNMFEVEVIPPEAEFTPKFDPMLGFPSGRKERTVKTTPEEMETAVVDPELRDYCVDKFMKFLACRRVHFPLNYKCKHEIHAYHDCEYEEFNANISNHAKWLPDNRTVQYFLHTPLFSVLS